MDRLTGEDRGVFLVKTQGSEHTWTITDDHVTILRESKRHNPFGMDAMNGRPYYATVKAWPEVGGCFATIINGGAGDVPWTRSSTIRSIERVE